jgi:hypothetical protein
LVNSNTQAIEPALDQVSIQGSSSKISNKITLLLLSVGCLSLTLLPIGYMSVLLATTGGNNISNDYWVYVAWIDKILDGTYDWSNYFRDTFMGGAHSMALPVLVRLAVVKFANWNIYGELYLGLAFSMVRLLLLHSAFTRLFKSRATWLLWPLLAALIFSVSQINVYSFGDAGLQLTLNQLGFSLGVWGLVRFPGRWAGISLMALGGIVATLSGGSGLLTWPIFLIGLILLGYYKYRYYALWLGAAVVAALPYIFYMLIQPKPSAAPNRLGSLLNTQYIINALGWPFADDILSNLNYNPTAWLMGWLGAGFCLAGIIFLAVISFNFRTLRHTSIFQKLKIWPPRFIWHQPANTPPRITLLAASAPSLMLMAFGLLSTWQISLLRREIAPWYTTPFMTFWIGMVGLAYLFWASRKRNEVINRPGYRRFLPWLMILWSITLSGVVVYFYLTSNINYTNKVYYLYSRTPASESCLRNYRTAPTYCEGLIFQWGIGNFDVIPTMGWELERHQLSAFGPQQEWSLQGDFVLNNVKLQPSSGNPEIHWSPDLSNQKLPWADYRHLNLFLPAPDTALWTVNLPANLKQAEFHSAIALSSSAIADAQADGVTFEVYIEGEGKAPALAFSRHLSSSNHEWQPFNIMLNAYAGQTITLHLTSNNGSNRTGDWSMYQYPHIDVELQGANKLISQPKTVTSPTLPALTSNDLLLDPTDGSQWKRSNMLPVPSEPGSWFVMEDPSLRYRKPLNLCLSDYSHVYIKMAASPEVRPRTLQVFYLLNEQPEGAFNTAQSFQIPLQGDGEMHEYAFDLKLLELPYQTRLVGLRFDPVYNGAPNDQSKVTITDFRLVKADHPSLCQP